MTAEELCNQKYKDFDELDSGCIWNNIENLMIDFAKYHVQKSLEAAAEKAIIDSKKKSQYGKYRKWQNVKDEEDVDLFSYEMKWEVNKKSILNSYSLDNIK